MLIMPCEKKLFKELKTSAKIQMFLIGTLGILTFVIPILVSLNSHDFSNPHENICVAEECVHTSAYFLENIDLQVNPCSDFHKFRCNRTENSNTLSLKSKKSLYKWRNLLELPSQENTSEPLKMLKTLYKTCTDSRSRDGGLIFLKQAFGTLGGWPVHEPDWNPKKFDWKQLLYRLRRSGWRYNFFLEIHIGPDSNDYNKNILTITQLTPLRLENEEDPENARAYLNYLQNLAILFGANDLPALVQMKEVVQFEKNLFEIADAQPEYSSMTIRQLQNKASGIPWLQLINNYLSPVVMLSSKDVINVVSINFLISLEDLLLSTQKRVLANYMFLKIVKDSILYLPDDFGREHSKFLSIVQKQATIEPRWVQCIQNIYKLHPASSPVYAEHFMKKSDEQNMLDLGQDIKNSILENIERSTWMEVNTKRRILNRIEDIKILTADWHDEEFEQNYKILELNSKSSITVSFYLSQISHIKQVSKLKKPKYDSVDILHDPKSSSLLLHAGILQEMIFNSDGPQSINYGFLGPVIANKLLRVVLKNENVCPDHSLDEFAASSAVKLAYDSYLKRFEHDEFRLPGLPFSPRQLFWIAASLQSDVKTSEDFQRDFQCPLNSSATCQLW